MVPTRISQKYPSGDENTAERFPPGRSLLYDAFHAYALLRIYIINKSFSLRGHYGFEGSLRRSPTWPSGRGICAAHVDGSGISRSWDVELRNRFGCDADLRVIAPLHNANTSLQMSAYSVFLETREPAWTFTGELGGREGEGERGETPKRSNRPGSVTRIRMGDHCAFYAIVRHPSSEAHDDAQHHLASLYRDGTRKSEREREKERAQTSTSFEFYICTRVHLLVAKEPTN